MELALLRAGDLHDLRTARLRQHVGQCPGCHARAAQLAAAESEFLFPTTGPGITTAAHRVATEAGRRRRLSRAFALALPMTAALGAVCLVGARSLWQAPATEEGTASSRTKGSFSAVLFRKRGESVTVADERMTFQPGDRLRFAYTAPSDGFVAVFGMDETGHLATYYPADSLSSLPVHAGQQVLLPDAIELDADSSDERLSLVFRETPWKDALLRGAMTRVRASTPAGSSATTTPLTLPGFAQASWLVKRQ